MSRNLSELSGRKGLSKNLFKELNRQATEKGTPSGSQLTELSKEYLFGEANLYGTSSFYDFLRKENEGKKVYVCNGSACMLAGTQDKVKEKLGAFFQKEEIGEMCCLGRCHENSAFNANGLNYSGHAIDSLDSIVKQKTVLKDKYHVECHGTQILTAEFPGIDAFYKPLVDILKADPISILDELKASGLRGRGGAGFPMAFKLEACRNAKGNSKYIVCNADEGDPGAFTDRYLLEEQPHLVLFGMMIAGFITGAEDGVLYIRAEYPESVEAMDQAVEDLTHAGWLGDNIKGTGFNFEFSVIKASGAYVCGEETALLSSIEGQRPEVRIRPPYPAQEGLFNKPTIVNNVETFASIHYILQHGGKKFAAIGRGKSTGTKLLSFDSFFNRPGVYEVDMGTPLNFAMNELGQGFKTKIKAIHIGGPLGGLVPAEKFSSLLIDFESFADGGFLLGHASFVCIPEEYPMVKYLEHLFEFTGHESCGKCFPCRIGSVRGAEMLKKAQHENYKISRKLFDDLVETLEIGSLCALGGGLPLPVKNALAYFPEELGKYFSK